MNVPNGDNKPIKTFNNKVERLTDAYENRLKNTFIESRDALYVISRHDTPTTFHFIDPPYYNANMGHYSGYTDSDFRALLELLGSIEGKFLLTCYPSDLMDEYALKYGWTVDRHDMSLAAGAKGKRKVECFVRNYVV